MKKRGRIEEDRPKKMQMQHPSMLSMSYLYSILPVSFFAFMRVFLDLGPRFGLHAR
jgi:hypothetical protein